jgi:hypothetical protein
MPFLADGVASGGYLLFGVFAASEHLGSKDWSNTHQTSLIYNHDASAMVTIKGDFGESGSFCCFAPILQPRFLAAAWATTFGDPLLPDCLRRAGLPGENLFPRQVYDRDHRKGTV